MKISSRSHHVFQSTVYTIGDRIAVSNCSLADVYTAHMFQYMFSQVKFKYIVIEKIVGYFSENLKTI